LLLVGGVAAVAIASALLAGAGAFTPRRAPLPEYVQVSYRRGLVSSARFAPDGRTFAYTASWDGQPYEIFHGRTESADARSLGLSSARLLSISPSSDMAVLFGPQSLQQSYGERTMARIPMAGGARRDLLTDVVDADWIPGTDTFAVIRDPGGNRPWTIEFPAGTPVHEARAAWSLRVSPDGRRIAFFEGPAVFEGVPAAMVTTIDRAGQKTTLTTDWAGYGLAWAPSGREIWFTATRGGVTQADGTTDPTRSGPQLQAVSLAGLVRGLDRSPDWLVLHDIAPDGTALLSRNTIRLSMNCRTPSDMAERDLGWLTSSMIRALSPDGASVVFVDGLSGRTAAGLTTVFRRGVDGSPAVAIGEGDPLAISPDGRWVLSALGDNLVLQPMGAGEMKTLPRGDLRRLRGGAWLDSAQVIFTASVGEGRPRVYRQTISDGAAEAVTPEGMTSGPASVRDDRTLLVRSDDRWLLHRIDGGGGEAGAVPALTSRDFPVAWSDHGRFLYAVEPPAGARHPSFDVFRVDLSTGRRDVWRTLAPMDTAGVETMPVTFRMVSDGSAYCYSYLRRLGDLFVVRGLQ
jgi:Tol biopolymer transport system component